MINWTFFKPHNFVVIGLIVILTRFAFYKAVNSLDGKNAQSSLQ